MPRRRKRKPFTRNNPVGTIRIREQFGNKLRFIKVRMDGPTSGRWIRLSRWLWEQKNGPVPDGHQIYHWDGNTLNDADDNLVALTRGQYLRRCHDLDPAMSEENRMGHRRDRVIETNQERGAVSRARKARKPVDLR
jgi:hypothetical protein